MEQIAMTSKSLISAYEKKDTIHKDQMCMSLKDIISKSLEFECYKQTKICSKKVKLIIYCRNELEFHSNSKKKRKKLKNSGGIELLHLKYYTNAWPIPNFDIYGYESERSDLHRLDKVKFISLKRINQYDWADDKPLFELNHFEFENEKVERVGTLFLNPKRKVCSFYNYTQLTSESNEDTASSINPKDQKPISNSSKYKDKEKTEGTTNGNSDNIEEEKKDDKKQSEEYEIEEKTVSRTGIFEIRKTCCGLNIISKFGDQNVSARIHSDGAFGRLLFPQGFSCQQKLLIISAMLLNIYLMNNAQSHY
jgi:hypothetical protein